MQSIHEASEAMVNSWTCYHWRMDDRQIKPWLMTPGFFFFLSFSRIYVYEKDSNHLVAGFALWLNIWKLSLKSPHYRINDDRCLWCFLHHLLKIYCSCTFGSLFTSIHMHTDTHTNMYVHKICMYAYSLVRRFPSAFAHQQMSTKIFVLWSCGCSYLWARDIFCFDCLLACYGQACCLHV